MACNAGEKYVTPLYAREIYSISISGSVNSKRPHLPPAFVFFWEKLQIPHNEAGRSWKPHGGALKWVANAPPRDNTKISFSIKNKLQTNANLWEILK